MFTSYLRHLANLRFALAGVMRAIRSEKSFHLILGGSIILLTISAILGTPLWRLAISGYAFLCTLGAELLNTALENLADKVQPNKDEQIGTLKDFAAAAIFIFGLGAFVLWLILTFF